MLARSLLLALLALASCSQRGEAPAALLGEVKQRLAARDTQLASYRLSGSIQDRGAEPVAITFAYRAPQRMRGSITHPSPRAFSWDGTRLYEQSDGDKRFTTFRSELPPDKLAGFLTEVFSPFLPEGFRTPLLLSSVVARRTTHPRAPEAVDLAMKLEDPTAQSLEMTYTLRWPTLDFLGKRTRSADGATAEVRVEDEHCEQALKLCVPRRLTRWVKGEQVGETTLSQVELNPALPHDTFTLTAPEGYDAQVRTLVEATQK